MSKARSINASVLAGQSTHCSGEYFCIIERTFSILTSLTLSLVILRGSDKTLMDFCRHVRQCSNHTFLFSSRSEVGNDIICQQSAFPLTLTSWPSWTTMVGPGTEPFTANTGRRVPSPMITVSASANEKQKDNYFTSFQEVSKPQESGSKLSGCS